MTPTKKKQMNKPRYFMSANRRKAGNHWTMRFVGKNVSMHDGKRVTIELAAHFSVGAAEAWVAAGRWVEVDGIGGKRIGRKGKG